MQALYTGHRNAKVGIHFCFSVCIYIPSANRFGWFWECANGEQCQYRHALPPGFVLKSQKKALEDAEKANQISLEEFLEVEVCLIAIGRHSSYSILLDL